MPDDVQLLSAEERATIAQRHRPFRAPGGEVGCRACSRVSSPDVDDGYGWKNWPCDWARYEARYEATCTALEAERDAALARVRELEPLTVTTLVACGLCGRGERARYLRDGMCIDCWRDRAQHMLDGGSERSDAD